jgi:3-methyladenine DNA glycosylase Tag
MVYIHPKPKNDKEFLEVMSEVIFVAGFRWDLVHKRWPKIRKAFHNFDVKKVANEKPENIISKDGMIKNMSKITAIIENAKLCQDIIKKHKTLMNWVKTIQKENKKEPLFSPTVREEMKRFHKIGHTTSRWMAYVTTREKRLLEKD